MQAQWMISPYQMVRYFQCIGSDRIMFQGKITVDSIDDKEDMGFVDEAFDILGFTKQEKVMK